MSYELSSAARKAARQATLNGKGWEEIICATIEAELAEGNLVNPADEGVGTYRILRAFGGFAVVHEVILPNGGLDANIYFMPANPANQPEAVAVCAVLNALDRKASKTTA